MSSKRLKLLLIRGLGHSGTTMLDLALGAHPQIIGLGEEQHLGLLLPGLARMNRRLVCIRMTCPKAGGRDAAVV